MWFVDCSCSCFLFVCYHIDTVEYLWYIHLWVVARNRCVPATSVLSEDYVAIIDIKFYKKATIGWLMQLVCTTK